MGAVKIYNLNYLNVLILISCGSKSHATRVSIKRYLFRLKSPVSLKRQKVLVILATKHAEKYM